jgi:hypothetical protein
MALNLMERMSAVKTETCSTSSQKRTWSSTNSDASGSGSQLGGGGGAVGGGGGGGGRPTHRSSSWRDYRNRQDSGYQGGFGNRFGNQFAGNNHSGDGGGRFLGGGGNDSRSRFGYGEQYGPQYGQRGGRR